MDKYKDLTQEQKNIFNELDGVLLVCDTAEEKRKILKTLLNKYRSMY